jgi:ATP-dependent 26S proteasome regulatory subunit
MSETTGEESLDRESSSNEGVRRNDDSSSRDSSEIRDIYVDELNIMSTDAIRQRTALIDSEIHIMKSDIDMINYESRAQRQRVLENIEKVKMNKQLPLLVSNIVEILDPVEEDGKYFIRNTPFQVLLLFIDVYPHFSQTYGKIWNQVIHECMKDHS